MNPLVAILLSLAVLVVGVRGYFEIFGGASSAANAQNTQQVIESIFSNASTMFENNPGNYGGFNNTAAIQGGVVPSAWVPTGQTTAIKDPWGGAVAFQPANINGGTANGYSFTLPNVPESECSAIADFATPQTASISINGASIGTNPSYGGTGIWPPTAAEVAVACSAAQNTVVWMIAGQ